MEEEEGFILTPNGVEVVRIIEEQYKAGFSLEEIAEHLGITVIAVRVLMLMASANGI